MTLRFTLLPLAAAMLAAPMPAFAAPAGKAEPHSAAAVQAADEHWGAAEESGDKAYIAWLLAPGYRSISGEGKATEKATIVAHAGAAGDPDRKAKVAKWKAEHPQKPVVQIFGDTAVLTWTAENPAGRVNSCDVFAYRDGHWHAVYSQHIKIDA